MKKLLVLLVIFSMLTAVGCSAASQTSALAGQTELSQNTSEKPYKELTGTVVVFGTSIWAMEPGPTGVAGRLEELTSFEVKDYSLLGGMATRIEGDSFSDISLVSILLYNSVETIKKMNPDAHIVLVGPTNGWGMEDGEYVFATELGRRVYAEYLAKNIYDYYFAVAITPPSSALRPSGSS
ncbi:MAG: hypothetical protein IKE92_07755 [Clostridiales bacterium]|nr:hypothetical protein [Clostridiales bacterium]